MNFVPFTEENEGAGQTWATWLKIDCNEEELRKLADLLEGNETYSIDLLDDVPESVAERICDRAKMGYMWSDWMLKGKFTCPVNEHNLTEQEFCDDAFYKGRIENHFKEE